MSSTDGNDASATISRLQAARLARTSEASIRRWEDAGLLTPAAIGPQAVRRYRASDVLAVVARKRSSEAARRDRQLDSAHEAIDGVVSAKAFRAFEAGESPISVVCSLQVEPRVVRTLHAEWVAMSGGIVLSRKHLDELEKLPLDSPIDSPASLLASLRACASRMFCSQCRKSPSSVCERCARPPAPVAAGPSTPRAPARPVPAPAPSSASRGDDPDLSPEVRAQLAAALGVPPR